VLVGAESHVESNTVEKTVNLRVKNINYKRWKALFVGNSRTDLDVLLCGGFRISESSFSCIHVNGYQIFVTTDVDSTLFT